MSPERWLEIKRIFHDAVDLTPVQQSEFLDSACNGDPSLRDEVEKMLVADSDPILELSPLATLSQPDPGNLNDRRIGRYRILHEIGRGGMGTVLAAVRDDGEFDQKVALKIILTGLNTTAIIQRFRNERQILASLEHPNIAHLIDGGMSDDGLPFYVMEFVDGEPINDYCLANELSVAQKLELFRQVCSAVSYAHGRLIVHRDLKPSNILVKDGQVKLLDFGIAKVLSDSDTVEPNTATQLGMMTPNYASPEQIRGEQVTTASDVYSLGVVLYELLTDSLPYDLSGVRLDEMLRIVCEVAPVRPSQATTQAGKNSSTTNRQNTSNLTRNPQLRGDLDNIILKALRKEPEHRYSSVEQFSEDIHRFLTGLPVLARAATFNYRAGKFIKRNRVSVTLAGLVLAILTGGIAATSWQAARAERERKLAQKRFDQSRVVANSLVFKYHDAIANLPNSSPVRELLLKDASAYLDNLAQDAKGDLSLQQELARAYIKLGDIQGQPNTTSIGNTAAAITSYEKAVSLLESIRLGSPATNIDARQDLLTTYKKLTTTLARAKENEALRRELNEKRIQLVEEMMTVEPDNFRLKIESADIHKTIGNRLFRADFDTGNEYYARKVLPMLEAAQRLSSTSAETEGLAVSIYSGLAYYSSEHGNLLVELEREPHEAKAAFQQALLYFQKVATIYEAQWKREPGDQSNLRGYAVGIVNIGISLRDLDRIDEAFSYLGRGRELYEEVAKFDTNNVQAIFDLGDLYTATAICHLKQKNYKLAIRDFQTSIAHMDKVISADSKHHEAISYKLDVLLRLGKLHSEMGESDAALDYYETARKYAETRLTKEPTDQVQIGRISLYVGRTLMRLAQSEGARAKSHELLTRAQSELQLAADVIEKAQAPESANQLRVVQHEMSKCKRALAS
jgi:eukaryotic-like serine/threonine-protein kinase